MNRHVYQSQRGGKTYVPIEAKHRFFSTATPRLAKMIGWKYAHSAGEEVVKDFEENHGRKLSKSLILNVVEDLGRTINEHESDWTYSLPERVSKLKDSEIALISIGRDGAHMPMLPNGWREAMCGTISLFNAVGERLHTIYLATTPERGKKTFDYLLGKEIDKIKKKYPKAYVLGIADGAFDNWKFLQKYVDLPILDFFHATTYLTLVAEHLPKYSKEEKKKWLDSKCHQLKSEPQAAKDIHQHVKELKNEDGTPLSENESVKKMLTYFHNHLEMMNYEQYLDNNYPIGSGVTEAACKIIIKQRLCRSGMRWSINGTNNQLILRTLCLTEGRWRQTWNKLATSN